MRIATWNVNSIKSRLDHVIAWSRSAAPDVLCLQETKTVDASFPVAKLRAAGFDHIAIHGEKAYNGVAILSKLPLAKIETTLDGDKADAPKRLIAATVAGVRVVNVYVPHGTAFGSDKFAFKLDFFDRLRRYFDRAFSHTDRVVLVGDINVAPHEMDVWNPRYWAERMHFTKPERDAIQNLKKWGFVDVFRQSNDEPGEYSWWDQFHNSFEKNRGLRIDHIWASPALAAVCTDSWIDREPRGWDKPSDHAPIVADFDV